MTLLLMSKKYSHALSLSCHVMTVPFGVSSLYTGQWLLVRLVLRLCLTVRTLPTCLLQPALLDQHSHQLTHREHLLHSVLGQVWARYVLPAGTAISAAYERSMAVAAGSNTLLGRQSHMDYKPAPAVQSSKEG